MEVETAGRAVDVHKFARKKEAWNTFAFHRLRIDFVERDAADGDDGLFQRTYLRDIQRHLF